jgi:uncharacterized membrane protein
MYTKAKIGGHPIHPMLVAFPVAFYTATLVAFAVQAWNGDPFWFRVALCANVAGVATALLAAIPGFIDWAFGIPAGSPAKTTGMAHMLLNVGALVAFAVNALVQWPHWDDARPAVLWSIGLPLLGVVLTGCAGWLGWKLVQKHHVGIELSDEQRRLEPAAWVEDRSEPSDLVRTRPKHG